MKSYQTVKGEIALLEDDNLVIQDVRSFLDAVISTGCGIVALKKENFSPAFYDLKTRIAGDILQKVSNYRIRLIIIGDFSGISSQSLKDFIYESNRTGHVVFAETLDNAVSLLK